MKMGELLNSIGGSEVSDTVFVQPDGTIKMDTIKPQLGKGLGECGDINRGKIFPSLKSNFGKDIDTIFNKKSINLYTVICNSKECIYQGIIATVPKNPIFIDLINHILISVKTPINDYHIFTKYFYNKLKEIYGLEKLINGKMVSLNLNTYLFNEECTINLNDCNDGLDRYGFCCHVYDNGEQIIKIRYSDYPWLGVAK